MYDTGDFSGRRNSSSSSNNSSSLVLRQLSRREPSACWNRAAKITSASSASSSCEEKCLKQDLREEDEDAFWGWDCYDFVDSVKKNVMVFVDGSRESRDAALWAACNLLNPADTLLLIHVFECRLSSRCKPDVRRLYSRGCDLLVSMRAVCRACRPEITVETFLLGSDHKGTTIVSQARKLNAAMLILGQRKPSLLQRLLRRSEDELLEYCIRNSHCMALGVRKQSGGIGGYIINSRWHKDFWLLA